MGIQFSPCNPCCESEPKCSSSYNLSTGQYSLCNTFTASDLSWLYQEDYNPAGSITLTHCETWWTYGQCSEFGPSSFYPQLNPSPWTFATLTYDANTETYYGEANPSPTDDLGLTMTIELHVCRASNAPFSIPSGTPHLYWILFGDIIGPTDYLQRIWMQYPWIKPPCNRSDLTNPNPWGYGKFITAQGWGAWNCYLCNRELYKAPKRLKQHRFLWMLPEKYKVNGGQYTTGQHWYNNYLFSYWFGGVNSSTPPFSMYVGEMEARLGNAVAYRPALTGLYPSQRIFAYEGTNTLYREWGTGGPGSITVDFEAWEL